MPENTFNIPTEDIGDFVDKYIPEGREVHEAVLVILSHNPGEPGEDQRVSTVSGYKSNNEIRRAMLDAAKGALA